MTMADEDVVDLDIFSGQTFGVAFKIGVEDDSRIIFFDDETSVVDEVELGSHNFFLLVKSLLRRHILHNSSLDVPLVRRRLLLLASDALLAIFC